MKYLTPWLLSSLFMVGLLQVSTLWGADMNIIPQPGSWELHDGTFALTGSTKIIWGGEDTQPIAELLQAALRERTGIAFAVAARTPGPPPEGCIILDHKVIISGARFNDGKYSLLISPTQLYIGSSTAGGVFYGTQSLLQLVSGQKIAAGKQLTLPAMSITDEPRFLWRGLMLDESRHFFGKKTVLELLDAMAYLKLNRLHWHLTDEDGWRIEIKKYPKLTEIGARGNCSDPDAPPAFYTQDEIREIVAFAAARQIVIVPEIDMPGHMTALCRAYPEYSGGGKGFTVNPAKEETYQFLTDVLGEVIPLFPGQYFHLGGDEVSFGSDAWAKDPQIVKFVKDHGLKKPQELERYFIDRMSAVVRTFGKTPMGWDDAAAGLGPKQSAVMWWHHERPGLLKDLLAQDFPVVLCPRIPCYFDFVQDASHKFGRRWNGFNDLARVYDFPDAVTKPLIPPGKEARIMGLEACLWTETVGDPERLEFLLFPRLAAIAEDGWTPRASKSKDDFMARLPGFLDELDRRHIAYFNPLDPAKTPEPPPPQKGAKPKYRDNAAPPSGPK